MPTYQQLIMFFKWLGGGVIALGTFMTTWVALGLPLVAFQSYVNDVTTTKIKPVQEATEKTKALVIDTQLQINKMTRQQLAGEKYRLETLMKTAPTEETNRRLLEVTEDLNDAFNERTKLFQQRQ